MDYDFMLDMQLLEDEKELDTNESSDQMEQAQSLMELTELLNSIAQKADNMPESEGDYVRSI